MPEMSRVGVNNDEYNECPMESERNLFEQRDCLGRNALLCSSVVFASDLVFSPGFIHVDLASALNEVTVRGSNKVCVRIVERVRWTLEKELKGCACRNPWARVDWTKLADFILEAVQKVEILYDSYLATVAKTRISSTLSISDSNRY